MTKLFLDTNVLLDLILKREPFAKWAWTIFKAMHDEKLELHTSSFAILTTYYISSKNGNETKARKSITYLLDNLSIKTSPTQILISSLDRNFNDYEDAVLHECAFDHGQIDFIITRDIKDFKKSLVEVMTPEEFCLTRM